MLALTAVLALVGPFAQAADVRPHERGREAAQWQKACDDGQPDACFRLGFAYGEGSGVPRDETRALDLLERACTLGGFRYCPLLAQDLLEGSSDRPPDRPRARRLLALSCEGGWGTSCLSLGEMELSEEREAGAPRSLLPAAELYEKGLRLLEHGCDQGQLAACAALGAALLPTRSGVPNAERALDLLRRACDGGEASGCLALPAAYSQQPGEEPDRDLIDKAVERARLLLHKACDSEDPMSCVIVEALERGEQVARKAAREAEERRQRADKAEARPSGGGSGPSGGDPMAAMQISACDRGVFFACLPVARMYQDGRGVTRDLARAAELLKVACDAEVPAACHELALAQREGRGIPRDRTAAERSFARACDLRVDESCQVLCDAGALSRCMDVVRLRDRLFPSDQEMQTLRPLMEKACAGGLADGCVRLAQAVREGRGGPADPMRALELLERACAIDATAGCTALAETLRTAHGPARDPRRALALLEGACTAGHGPACRPAGSMRYQSEAGPPNAQRALELFERGCRAGDADSCYVLGLNLAAPGPAQDRARARVLFRAACLGGSRPGCEALAEPTS
jgi:TPR repeat protein